VNKAPTGTTGHAIQKQQKIQPTIQFAIQQIRNKPNKPSNTKSTYPQNASRQVDQIIQKLLKRTLSFDENESVGQLPDQIIQNLMKK
jgi:hypothetical protein